VLSFKLSAIRQYCTETLSIPAPETEQTSSFAQLSEQWSKTMLCTGPCSASRPFMLSESV